VVQHTDRLRTLAVRAISGGLTGHELRGHAGDLFLQMRALVSGASPILADLADAADTPITFDADDYRVTYTAAFAVPGLSLRMAADQSL